MAVTMNIAKTRPCVVPRMARRREDVWPEVSPRGLFAAALLENRMSHIACDALMGSFQPNDVALLGEPGLVRVDRASGEIEAFVRLSGGCIVLIDAGYGNVNVEVAGRTRAAVEEAAQLLRTILENSPSESDRPSVAFWMRGSRGGDFWHGRLQAPAFEAIAGNYPEPVRAELERLVATRRPQSGGLILYRGEPGTGKSYAVRALVRAWAPWCSAHFIVDPGALLAGGPGYLLDVLTWDGDGDDRWRLLILEDAGEFISSEACTLGDEALSRLLNLTDGMLGHATRALVLITTNESVGLLHPVIRRAGRCLADIAFAPHTIKEANTWLSDHGKHHRVDTAMTLAELYSHPDEHTTTTRTGPLNSTRVPPFACAYDVLRLRIDMANDTSYRVLASTSSAEAHERFDVPFAAGEIEELTKRISEAIGSNRLSASGLCHAKRFGEQLFKSLFRDEVYGLYRDALAEARCRGRGLRITLCLSGSPELIDLPWEYLFDAPNFLAISSLTPVVRYLDLPRSYRSLSGKPPLRILGVVSSPADYQPLDVQRERANLERALSDLMDSGAVEVCWLEQPTLERLLRDLQRTAFHALHYIGHGRYDEASKSGLLLFEDESGWGSPVSGEKLGTVLHEFESLRLAVLNACDGARCSHTSPFAGAAEALVQHEIPAVIAMRCEISDEGANVFADGFYSAIANGSPVDAAVSAARLAMFARRRDDIEWGTPALYMRAPDGRVFDVPDADASQMSRPWDGARPTHG